MLLHVFVLESCTDEPGTLSIMIFTWIIFDSFLISNMKQMASVSPDLLHSNEQLVAVAPGKYHISSKPTF